MPPISKKILLEKKGKMSTGGGTRPKPLKEKQKQRKQLTKVA